MIIHSNYSFQYNRYTDIIAAGETSLSHDLADTTTYTASSKDMPRVSQHKANLGFTLNFRKHHISITPIYHFVGRRPNVITSPIAEIPEYHLMNLSLAYINPQSNWEFTTYIFNVLDKEINDPGTRDAKGDYYSPLRPEARLSIWAKLTYKL